MSFHGARWSFLPAWRLGNRSSTAPFPSHFTVTSPFVRRVIRAHLNKAVARGRPGAAGLDFIEFILLPRWATRAAVSKLRTRAES